MLNANLRVNLDGDGSRLDRVLSKGQAAIGGFAKGAREKLNSNLGNVMAGYFSINTVKSLTTDIMNLADTLGDFSAELGISESDLYALRKAGADVGLEFEGVAGMLRKVAEAKDKVMKGDDEKTQLLASVGLSPEKLAGMSSLEIAKYLGQSVQGMNVADRNQFAGNVMGEGGAKNFNRLADTLSDFENWKETNKSMLANQSDLEILAANNQKLDDLKSTIEAGLIPIISVLIRTLLDGINKSTNWVEKQASRIYARSQASDSWTEKTGMSRFDYMNKVGDEAFNQAEVEIAKREAEMEAVLNRKKEPAPPPATPQLFKKKTGKTDKAETLDSMPVDIKGDSLTSVGNFLGGSVTTLEGLSKQANEYLRAIKVATEKLATKNNNDGGIVA